MKHARIGFAAVLMLASALGACHFDTWVGEITDDDHLRPPPAPPTTVSGRFSAEDPIGVPNSPVAFYLGDGSLVDTLEATTGADGAFSVQVGGTTSYSSLYAYATSGSVALLGIIPEIPGATSVYDLPRSIDLAQEVPALDPIDVDGTAIVLLIEGRLRQQGSSLSNLSADTVRQAVADVAAALDEENFVTFVDMVDVLLAEAANQPSSTIPVFLPPSETVAAGSSLNTAFLAAFPVNYDGDMEGTGEGTGGGSGTVDTTTDAFEAALQAAMAEFTFDICYDPDLIRTVFLVNFNEGLLDSNCEERDREKWLQPEGINAGDVMHLVGGVHQTQIRCEDQPDFEFCATQGDIELTNTALSGVPGGWIPNQVPMYDDGTNGDAVAGDNIYTRVFDLPRGLRIGYKYTYGPPGNVWTSTEEWPGNQRILELVDVNGDGMVVRRDNFGDEGSNKDRSNDLSPRRGGRGSVLFSCGEVTEGCCEAADSPEGVAGCVDANGDGYLDYQEIPVDFDGDCVIDRYPTAGPVTPLTVECPE